MSEEGGSEDDSDEDYSSIAEDESESGGHQEVTIDVHYRVCAVFLKIKDTRGKL